MQIDYLKNDILVFDIETWAEYGDGREVNIKTNFDDYVALARCRWFGAYSYRTKKEYYLEVSKNRQLIAELLSSHSVLVGFNNEEFDYPIVLNNGLGNDQKKVNQVDCLKILGASNFLDKKGNKYKNRGELMDFKFKSNSLENVAKGMKLEFQKSEIDYHIFKNTEYTEAQAQEIIQYLRNDVMATKGMFDKLWDYWLPFTDMLDEYNIQNLSWIKSSIASLIYKSACFDLGTEPTYNENKEKKKEEMGGRVLLPRYEEAHDAWYVDVTSLYPHIFVLFNLFSETKEETSGAWHGNEVFKVKGYYDISHQNSLAKIVQKKLKQRGELRALNPNDPMVYTLKIWLNGLYGVARSSVFEKIHTPNCGWDCCWLGQQIHELMETELNQYGFETIYGDTDSLIVRSTDKELNKREYVSACLRRIVKKILANSPFQADTFNIKIEDFLHYIVFPFSEEEIVEEETRKLLTAYEDNEIETDLLGYIREERDGKKVIVEKKSGKVVKQGRSWVKERRGKKKNYAYIHDKKGELNIKLVGLPIIKDNATPLGIKIYNEVLRSKILEQRRAKFDKSYIDQQIGEYLKKKEILELLAVEFKVNPLASYKVSEGKDEATGIHAQISKGYFNGSEGVISLIKNSKIGKAGKGMKYCTVEEAIEAKLTLDDLDLEKVYNELEPFMIYEPVVAVEKPRKTKKSKTLTEEQNCGIVK